MSGTSSGFTLIELLIVLVIMGIAGAVIVPNLSLRRPEYERKTVIAQLNRLLRYAWNNALISGKIHRIFFDFEVQKVRVDVRASIDSLGEPHYEGIPQSYAATDMKWPDNLKIKNFIVEGFDEMAKFGEGANQIWFFVLPDGVSQQVTINILDVGNQKKAVRFGLVLNPFQVQFKEYDGYQT